MVEVYTVVPPREFRKKQELNVLQQNELNAAVIGESQMEGKAIELET